MEPAKRGIFGIGAFGSQIWNWVRGRTPFYPLWQNFFFNRRLPVYVDFNNLMLVYISCPTLRTVILEKANMWKTLEFELVQINEDGTEDIITDHPLLDLHNRPNPINKTKNNFLQQMSVFYSIYNYRFIKKVKGSRKAFPSALYNLPPAEMKVIPTGKMFDQVKIDGIIDHFEHTNNGSSEAKIIPIDEIMFNVDDPQDRYFGSVSKLLSLKTVISNIEGLYKTRNILIHERGANGILSSSNSDREGGLPLDDDERKRIDDEYINQYGISEDQARVVLTASNLKWLPMTFPVKDLMLDEGREESFQELCAAFGVARAIFPQGRQAKGVVLPDGNDDIDQARKETMLNTILPEAMEYCDLYNNDPDYGLKEEGLTFRPTAKHLPYMQEDQVSEEDIRTQRAGTTAQIIALNAAVQGKQMTYESAVAILVNRFNIDEAEAQTMISQPLQTEPAMDDDEESEENLKHFKIHLNGTHKRAGAQKGRAVLR